MFLVRLGIHQAAASGVDLEYVHDELDEKAWKAGHHDPGKGISWVEVKHIGCQ